MSTASESIFVVSDSEEAGKRWLSIFNNGLESRDVKVFSDLKAVEQALNEMSKTAKSCFLVWVDCSSETLKSHAEVLQRVLAGPDEAIWIFVDEQGNDFEVKIAGMIGEAGSERWLCLKGPLLPKETLRIARMHANLARRGSRTRRLQRMTQVARGLGHEFSNILFKVGGRADLATMETDPKKIQLHLESLLQAVEHGGRLVKELQTLPKGGLRLPLEIVEPIRPLEEALKLLNRDISHARVEVSKDYATVPRCRMDVPAVTQVYLNLISNAVRSMSEGGKLHLTAKTVHREGQVGVLVGVSDTGGGIRPDVLPRIFEFGFSAWAEKQGERGAGVGLAIALEIVEAHGGAMDVASEPGKGAAFSVFLPSLPV